MKVNVSIKGVVKLQEGYLLRQNERDELELIGGRLEKGDTGFHKRLKIEFIEEAGHFVEVKDCLQPFFYSFNNKSTLIIPYNCNSLAIDSSYTGDLDGGLIVCVNENELSNYSIPIGFLDSLEGKSARNSSSINSNCFKYLCQLFIKHPVHCISSFIKMKKYDVQIEVIDKKREKIIINEISEIINYGSIIEYLRKITNSEVSFDSAFLIKGTVVIKYCCEI